MVWCLQILPIVSSELNQPGSCKLTGISGDSYTTTGFNLTMTQPSPGNPLGNPPYPGYTAVNGPGWVDDLTVEYNQSFIETYNLAYGGATVDSALVAQYEPTVLDFVQQVNQEFLPVYGTSANVAGWTADNSLFAAFFGINDVGNSYGAQNDALNGEIFSIYLKLINQVGFTLDVRGCLTTANFSSIALRCRSP